MNKKDWHNGADGMARKNNWQTDLSKDNRWQEDMARRNRNVDDSHKQNSQRSLLEPADSDRGSYMRRSGNSRSLLK